MSSTYFSKEDLECHCGCGREYVSRDLIDFLDDLQEEIGTPLELSCAYRCPEHNREVGGVPNSTHVQGLAADIIVPEDWTVDNFADVCEKLGADGVGRYYVDGFVHADVREGRTGAGYSWEE